MVKNTSHIMFRKITRLVDRWFFFSFLKNHPKSDSIIVAINVNTFSLFQFMFVSTIPRSNSIWFCVRVKTDKRCIRTAYRGRISLPRIITVHHHRVSLLVHTMIHGDRMQSDDTLLWHIICGHSFRKKNIVIYKVSFKKHYWLIFIYITDGWKVPDNSDLITKHS